MGKLWENIETDPTRPPKLGFAGLLLGFGLLAVFVVIVAFIFANLGCEPSQVGPLPWMAK